jgi:hypothetical protein
MENNSFYYRLMTIRPNFHYPPGYEPRSLLDGNIAYWQPRATGLTSFSQPKDVTAIFKANSLDIISNEWSKKTWEQDPKHHYYWPLPDSEYAKFEKIIINV